MNPPGTTHDQAGGVRDGDAFGPMTIADARTYLDGFHGLNDLSVGPHMLAWALECTLNRASLLISALTAAIEIAGQARDEWDVAPQGMKAGKLLIALSGDLDGYRPDIDAIHRIYRTATARPAERDDLAREDPDPSIPVNTEKGA